MLVARSRLALGVRRSGLASLPAPAFPPFRKISKCFSQIEGPGWTASLNCGRSNSISNAHKRFYSDDKALVESRILVLRNEITGADVYLLGTVHISEASAEELINDVRPDAVMIELDRERAMKLKNEYGRVSDADFARVLIPASSVPARFSMPFINPAKILEEMIKKFYSFFKHAGIVPGKEFLVAMQEAAKVGARVVLGDRKSTETIERIFDSFTMSSLMRTLSEAKSIDPSILISPDMKINPSDPQWVVQYAERLKTRNDVRKLVGTIERLSPGVAKALIHERDAIMVQSIRAIKDAKRIVAVVGLGHLDGMEAQWTRVEARFKELGISEKTHYDELKDG